MKWDSLRWEMGLSAQAIAGGGSDYPRDPSDLVRCVKYCESRGITAASLRGRMASRSIQWDRLTANWDGLVALLKSEIETRTDGMATRTYVEMKRVVAGGTACPSCSGTGRGTECIKCKGSGRRSGGHCRAERCYRGADYCPACHGQGFTTTNKAA